LVVVAWNELFAELATSDEVSPQSGPVRAVSAHGLASSGAAATEARIDELAAYADSRPWIDREPTDDELANGHNREGGIAYTVDEPGSLGENDWRL